MAVHVASIARTERGVNTFRLLRLYSGLCILQLPRLNQPTGPTYGDTILDERTEALIRELADKLGTTGEHLWGVLVRQAVITGVGQLLALVAFACLTAWAFRLIKQKTLPPSNLRSDEAGALWVIWGIVAGMAFVGGVMQMSRIIGAIFNPEYWALMQLLR